MQVASVYPLHKKAYAFFIVRYDSHSLVHNSFCLIGYSIYLLRSNRAGNVNPPVFCYYPLLIRTLFVIIL